jgi:hypothetical protein
MNSSTGDRKVGLRAHAFADHEMRLRSCTRVYVLTTHEDAYSRVLSAIFSGELDSWRGACVAESATLAAGLALLAAELPKKRFRRENIKTTSNLKSRQGLALGEHLE